MNVRPVRYVMLFPGRTGSTYITDHMSNHPDIYANYEVLWQFQDSWEQQKDYLDRMFKRGEEAGAKAIGFKSKLNLVYDLPVFESYLRRFQFRIINLTRTNHLKFVVSIVRAKMLRAQNGSSNLIDDQHQELGPTSIPLSDFAKAKTRLRRNNRISQLIDRVKLPSLEISYEDLLNDEAATLKTIWDFLGVRNIATTGITSKSYAAGLANCCDELGRNSRTSPGNGPLRRSSIINNYDE